MKNGYPPRPVVTQEMVVKAALKFYPDQDAAESIAEVYEHHMDGYELAKELERSQLWDCNRQDVDELDNVAWEVHKLLREAEQQWANENDVQPSLPVGSRVSLPRHGAGEITGVSGDHSPACYLVKPDGQDDASNGSRRYVIKFEDARPAESWS